MCITIIESDNYYGKLKMYCLISKTCDAIRSIENEDFMPIDSEYKKFQS